MSQCKRCEHDVSELMNWDTLCEKYIECPNCGLKMTVNYDESYNETDGEDSWWWLELYEE